MDMLNLFRSTRKRMSLDEAAQLIDTDSEQIYEPAGDVKHVYVYFDCLYVVELCNGKFWTIVEGSEWYCDSLSEIELYFYIPANQLILYSIKHVPKDINGMVAELVAFCTNHGYPSHSADELLYELGDTNAAHQWYLMNYIERWETMVLSLAEARTFKHLHVGGH